MRFSIIIPVYNCENKLHISVNSIINQSYTDWELILVNDGSTDKSLEICRRYASNDNRIIVIDQKNSGPGSARNNGIRSAKGDYVLFCDADDYLKSHALETANVYIANNDWDIIIWGYADTKKANNMLIMNKHISSDKEFNSNLDFKSSYEKLDDIAFTYPIWNKVYKKSLITRTRAVFPAKITVAEDFIFNIQIFKKAEKVLITHDLMYLYIQHSNSLTTSFNMAKLVGIEFVYTYAIKEFSDWHPVVCNRIRNAYIRDISVFINNMHNRGISISYNKKRKIIKTIIKRNSVKECISNIECTSNRNRIIVFLLKHKMINGLLLTGFISRLKHRLRSFK